MSTALRIAHGNFGWVALLDICSIVCFGRAQTATFSGGFFTRPLVAYRDTAAFFVQEETAVRRWRSTMHA
jgi:hypothetical protein